LGGTIVRERILEGRSTGPSLDLRGERHVLADLPAD
jgi:hypothetical protein